MSRSGTDIRDVREQSVDELLVTFILIERIGHRLTFSGFMIPKINCVAKFSGAIRFGAHDEIVPASILSHGKRVCGKTVPLTHFRRLCGNIVARARKPLAIGAIEEWNQPPVFSSHIYFATVVLQKPGLQAERESEPNLRFGL